MDRLLKQISGYVSEISDEFKVIVVDAVRALCLKFPSKHAAMLDFLGSLLREEGGQEHKEATVSAICELIQQVGPAKESGTGCCFLKYLYRQDCCIFASLSKTASFPA